MVTDPFAAIEATKHVRPDVLVIDVRLPGMSGLELYDRLTRDSRTRGIPVLFETGQAGDVIDELRRRGVATLLRKPFDPSQLVGYIKRLAGAPAG